MSNWTVRTNQNDSFQKQYLDNTLTHYGVKGMKWGVRKDRKSSSKSSSKNPSNDSEASIIEKLIGKPLVKLPHPKVSNPKLQKAIDIGVNTLQPYASPGGLVVLGVCALIPGFGVGTIAAGQLAYESLKNSGKFPFNDTSKKIRNLDQKE